jgi:molecular chaperone GrpE
MMEKTPDVSEAVVGEDFLRGYSLKDRIIRSAKVKVLMPADEPQTDGPAAEAPSSSVTNDGQN